jgi:hypothetical protein
MRIIGRRGWAEARLPSSRERTAGIRSTRLTAVTGTGTRKNVA